MAQLTWDAVGSVVSLLSTELNALASGGATAYGPEINNTSGPQLAILWLHLASNSLAFTATSYCDVLLVSSTTPGTAAGTYPTFTSGASYKLANSNYYVASIFINPTTQAANVVEETIPNIMLPSGYYKTVLVNNSGVALPASGNTLKLYSTPQKIV